MRVEYRVLGTIDLRAIEDGHAQALDLPPKIRALLAYLALERPRQWHARDTLTALFWPELDEEHARSNLRRALYVLRAQIGSEVLITRGQGEVGLDRERFWCDGAAFDELLEKDPEGALTLYRGELLPAVHLDGSAEFERWLEVERTRLRDRAQAALGELAGRAESAGRLAEAVRWQRKALEIDPYDEGSLRRLMQVRARLGDRAGALQVYEAFERRLKEDLDLEPDDETRALAEAVRAGEIAVEKPAEAIPTAASRAAATLAVPDTDEVPRARIETESGWEHRRVPKAAVFSLPAIAAALGLLLFLTGREDPSVTGPVEAVASGAAPGIAVVPFQVSDPSLELWREGMVDLLSKNLDGAAGLRAISSRTVMARWREASPQDEVLDLAQILEVARRAGGEYAVVGSAVALGPDIRLMADVYGLEDLAHLGQAQVEGSPDSVFALVDRLSVGLLRTIVGSDEEVPSPRLASVTTSSLPALKAFLEGEQLYRRAQFDQAVDAYKRAVTADSTFALAHFRFAHVSEWLPPDRRPEFMDSYLKVLEHREKLSQRDAEFIVVHANPGFRPGYTRDIHRLSVRKYPDDPEAWYLLGEVLFHRGGPLLADNDEAETAFKRAVALDPTFAPYWTHLLDKVFLDADSAQAASVIATLDRLDPRALRSGDRFAFTVTFGDSLASRQALAGIDTLSDDALAVASRFLGLHPGTFAAQEAVLREDLSRKTGQDPVWVAHLVALYLIRQGKRSAALQQLADPRVPSWTRFWDLYYMSIVGLQPPAELLESAFESFEEPRPLTLTRDWFWGGRDVLVLSAAYAADRGQWPRHASILQTFRQFAREYAAGDAPNDSTNARILLGTVRALEGYGLWRQGQPEKALSLLEAGQQERLPDYQVLHWWLGRLLLELDRPADALRYFEALRESERDPFAAFEAARIHERLGNKAAALEGFEYALTAWRDGDPVIRPRVEAARAALRRLSGAAD